MSAKGGQVVRTHSLLEPTHQFDTTECVQSYGEGPGANAPLRAKVYQMRTQLQAVGLRIQTL